MQPSVSRRMTIVDGMVLTAGIGIGIWVSGVSLIPWIRTFLSIPPEIWAKNPFWLTWHWGSLILRHTQPMAAILTLAVSILGILQPRPVFRRLVRQPGFTACVATAIAICISGGLSYATTKALFDPGYEIQGYTWIVLLPIGSEPGIAVASCWVLLAIGRRWRSERSWIDRLGRLLGVYWLIMSVIARFGSK